MSETELLASIQAALKKARAGLPQNPRSAASAPASPPAEPSTHTDRRGTREISVGDSGVPTPRYTETVEAAEKALDLGGFLPPLEVVKIQNAHNHLYMQYMNPAFMMHLQRTKKFNAVYPSLDLVIKNPYDFDYVSLPNHRTEIHRRETSTNGAIRPDFLVVLETTEGHITEVNNHKLKNDTGGIPWMSQREYNSQMPNWDERWTVEDKRTDVPVTEEMKALFMLNNVEFPKRFLALIDSRRFEFEQRDPLISDLRTAFAVQENLPYDQIVANRWALWKVGVFQDSDPGNEGGYQIWINTASGGERVLHVSKESFIMRNASGSDDAPQWTADPLYHNAIRWQYYQKPEAKATLSEAERTQMETEQGQVKANQEELDRREKQREKRRKVDEALKTADFETLKAAATAVVDSKNAGQKETIDATTDTEKDKTFLKEGIKSYITPGAEVAEGVYATQAQASENLDKVAVILNVQDTTPTTPPVATP